MSHVATIDKKKKIMLFIALILGSFVADIGTKVWAQKTLTAKYINPKTQSSFRINFNLAYNRGAAFSLGSNMTGGRWLLTLIRLAALGFIYYLFTRPEANHKLFLTGLGLVGGGALGNLVETIIFGKVTDFIQFWGTPAVQQTWPWPTFNVADVVLLVGVGLMLVYSFVAPKTAKKGREQHEIEKKSSTKKRGKRS